MKTEIIQKQRTVGGYEYHTCENCSHENKTGTVARIPMPYCGSCNKIVLDADQKFCCWCGTEFD